ncbi:Alpha/beta hydrolase fold-1 [Lentinula raphanica]|nr:Alpha/beta hydrolase fold-1 [Lentinula raphanica]KAJ3972606.1 Alpha/beta hydrolase fold-1 [Lentinula raphanica]
MSTSLLSELYTFDPRPYYPLLSTVKRYRDPSWTEDGLTLVFAHGTGFHKEQWEPTIDDLQGILVHKGPKTIRIREIWTIDAPNHGDAALLNEQALQHGYEPVFQWQEYARSIHAFLTGRGKTFFGTPDANSVEDKVEAANSDFSTHRLVGIGHSMGAISLLLALDFVPSLESQFVSMILVEPMTMEPVAAAKGPARRLASGSESRRDIWSSKEDAYNMLKSRKTWQVWDDRVLRIFVETGLRPLPTLDYPNIKEGVTLKCTRRQETAAYRDTHGWVTIYRGFRTYASRVRIHLYYGRIHDYIPGDVKEDVMKNASGGTQNLASFGYIDGAGHTAPQHSPHGVAEKIFLALMTDAKATIEITAKL